MRTFPLPGGDSAIKAPPRVALGLRQHTKFEGQAAMALEFVIGALETDAAYPFDLHTAARRNDLHAQEDGRAAGFRPYWHQRIPPNDGGIALGQAVVAGKQKLE